MAKLTYSQKYIANVEKLEAKARKLQNELDIVHSQWQNNIDSLHTVYLKEWRAHCDAKGVASNYTFGDILA